MKKDINKLAIWSWLYSETDDFVNLVGRILASLPGGENLEDIYEPLQIGWKEVELLEELLNALQDAESVRLAVRRFSNVS